MIDIKEKLGLPPEAEKKIIHHVKNGDSYRGWKESEKSYLLASVFDVLRQNALTAEDTQVIARVYVESLLQEVVDGLLIAKGTSPSILERVTKNFLGKNQPEPDHKDSQKKEGAKLDFASFVEAAVQQVVSIYQEQLASVNEIRAEVMPELEVVFHRTVAKKEGQSIELTEPVGPALMEYLAQLAKDFTGVEQPPVTTLTVALFPSLHKETMGEDRFGQQTPSGIMSLLSENTLPDGYVLELRLSATSIGGFNGTNKDVIVGFGQDPIKTKISLNAKLEEVVSINQGTERSPLLFAGYVELYLDPSGELKLGLVCYNQKKLDCDVLALQLKQSQTREPAPKPASNDFIG